MDRWRSLVRSENFRSMVEQMGRDPYGEDALDPAMHPENYGATDDIRPTATADSNSSSSNNNNDNGDQEANQPSFRATVDQAAHKLAESFGPHTAAAAEPRHRVKRQKTATDATDATNATATTTQGTSGPETPEEKPSVRRHTIPAIPEEGIGESMPSGATSGTGLLSLLLKMQSLQNWNVSGDDDSDNESPAKPDSPAKPAKWYEKYANGERRQASSSSLPILSSVLNAVPQPRRLLQKQNEQVKLTVHIADLLARQKYIMQLCRAMMSYGAPTHRLEQYMLMTANVLDVSAQFLYLPGCMVMSFDDPETQTAQVKLVRANQGLDLGRLCETHDVYKNVVHDRIGVEEAVHHLDDIMKRKPRYNKPMLVLLSGLFCTAIGPWAFEARPIDLPIIFFLGSFVGFMQHVVAPHSVLYSNVFEVSMAIITSFLARAFGSIPANNTIFGERERVFCFASISQSSISLILPGFSVLCSSLELQSHQIIAGSVRIVYTIIYSLFLGYGVTVGTTIYGLLDSNATTQTTCPGATSLYHNEYIQHFPFVAIFCCLAGLANQAKLKQTPMMMVFGVAGYVTNYFCTQRIGSGMGLANTIGAFTIGTLANLYSRIWHGHAASAIVPGIFTLVSSGLAASGAIISGLAYSNAIQEGPVQELGSVTLDNNSLTGLGLGMVQVAIGVSVGLFVSAVLVYPYGKQRSGLFNF